MNEMNFTEAHLLEAYSSQEKRTVKKEASVVPFFSMRKLRLVFNELAGTDGFEYRDFDTFKHHVLSSFAPQLELSKWQSIAARR